jgi:hypothetical protein
VGRQLLGVSPRRRIVVLATVAALAGVSPVASQSIPIGTFSLVATHPEAAAYPALGNALVGLTPWHGRLFTGYGHWVEFFGLPNFAIRAYDPAADVLVEQFVTGAEGIWNYRSIGDKLYAPVTDPSEGVDYVVGVPWQSRDAAPGTKRLFDMAGLGADLFMVGSTGADAVVWRSSDEGQTWQEALRITKQDQRDLETHFGFALVTEGNLYVQAYGVGWSGAHPTSKVFDGTSWSDGPNLLPDWRYKGWKPTPFGRDAIYLSGEPGNAAMALMRFDGVQANEIQTPYRFWDFVVAGDYLYALVVEPGAPLWAPEIRRTRDLTTWTHVAEAPTDSRSLGILGQTLYIGATAGRLFEYSEPLRELGPRRSSRTPRISSEPDPALVVSHSAVVRQKTAYQKKKRAGTPRPLPVRQY